MHLGAAVYKFYGVFQSHPFTGMQFDKILERVRELTVEKTSWFSWSVATLVQLNLLIIARRA